MTTHSQLSAVYLGQLQKTGTIGRTTRRGLEECTQYQLKEAPKFWCLPQEVRFGE
jgi:hypothetical protein